MSAVQQMLASYGTSPPSGPETLYQIIARLGLTSGLKLCLDAGDASSYNPAVQSAKWLDTSGNGYDFWRGSSSVGDGAEPAFVGVAGGLSAAEYFRFDGNDVFNYDSSIEPWMRNLSRDNAKLTVMSVFYLVSGSLAYPPIFVTTNTSNRQGFELAVGNASGKRPAIAIYDSAGGSWPTSGADPAITDSLNLDAWNFVAATLNEPSNTATYVSNAVTASTTCTYTKTSTTESPPRIGYTNSGANRFLNNMRMACLAVWEGTSHTPADLQSIRAAINPRFGLAP